MKKNIFYIYMNDFAVQQKLTQHCKSTSTLRGRVDFTSPVKRPLLYLGAVTNGMQWKRPS